MIAALRTPRHAVKPFRSTTQPSTRISTPYESTNTSPSELAKVSNVFGRVLDFAGGGLKKMNGLLDVKWDDKHKDGDHKDSRDGGRYKRSEVEMEEVVASMLDLQSALRTIPSEDNTLYAQSPLPQGPLGKAAQILGIDDELPALTSRQLTGLLRQQEEYSERASLASDADEESSGPPGAARRHFCSEINKDEALHSLYPATQCCWGGHLGPIYLDHVQEPDNVSPRSSIAPVPAQGRKPAPLPSPPMTPPIIREEAPSTERDIAFDFHGRGREGWPRERPYPYLMERDVEPVIALAGRVAIDDYSRYPTMPRRQPIN